MEHTRLRDKTVVVVMATAGGLAVLAALVWFAVLADDRTEHLVFGSIWLGAGLLQVVLYSRTGSKALSIWMLMCFMIAASYFLEYKGPFFFVPAAVLLGIGLYLVVSRRLVWKYPNVLQLAASTVDRAEDGFTARPYPLREVQATSTELRRFGRFLADHLIAFPFHDADGMYLCVNASGANWFRRPRVSKDTYVFFPRSGPVSVNIARKEYDQFREELSFDLLCQSLGDLFVRFLDLYRQGKVQELLELVDEG